MLPLRDKLPTRTTPWITWLLLAANIAAFLYTQAAVEAGYDDFLLDWGFVPRRFSQHPAAEFFTMGTAMFLHGGWLHLGGNMLFLWIFGDNVEDRMGKTRYLIFYLLAGIAAAAAQYFVDPASRIPMVGASGAIAGVLGAYGLLYPRSRITVVFPIFIFLQFFELPAWVVIAEWFVLQLLNGVGSLGGSGATGGVAFFAHIGGFVAGLLLVKPLVKFPQLSPATSDSRRWQSPRRAPPWS